MAGAMVQTTSSSGVLGLAELEPDDAEQRHNEEANDGDDGQQHPVMKEHHLVREGGRWSLQANAHRVGGTDPLFRILRQRRQRTRGQTGRHRERANLSRSYPRGVPGSSISPSAE
jgi:hypothetical protein